MDNSQGICQYPDIIRIKMQAGATW